MACDGKPEEKAQSRSVVTQPGFSAWLPKGLLCGLEHADGPACLGIMGGTFDPIHFGHLSCAERVRETLELDGVLFIPAGDPAFKQGQNLAAAEARLAMCALAVADNPHFEVSDIELQRAGVTYTVDTLEALRQVFPEWVEFVFIIGLDSLLSLSSWKNAHRLAELARFACVMRPGYHFEEDIFDDVRAKGFQIELIEAPLMDISSSEIRKLCRQGDSIRYLTPSSVCAFITQRELYRS